MFLCLVSVEMKWLLPPAAVVVVAVVVVVVEEWNEFQYLL